MSVEMIDYIVDEHNIEIDSATLKGVKVYYAIWVFTYLTVMSSGAMFSELLKFDHIGRKMQVFFSNLGIYKW